MDRNSSITLPCYSFAVLHRILSSDTAVLDCGIFTTTFQKTAVILHGEKFSSFLSSR